MKQALTKVLVDAINERNLLNTNKLVLYANARPATSALVGKECYGVLVVEDREHTNTLNRATTQLSRVTYKVTLYSKSSVSLSEYEFLLDQISNQMRNVVQGRFRVLNMRKLQGNSDDKEESPERDKQYQHSKTITFFSDIKEALDLNESFLTHGSTHLPSVPLAIELGGTSAITANQALNNLLPSQTGNAGEVLTTNGTNVSWVAVSAGDTLPSQTGNSGKFLSTNGTVASWETVPTGDTLPSQTGNSGKFLSTNGTVTSWETVSSGGTPGGANTQIQFNSSGAFGGSNKLTWDGTKITVTGGTAGSGVFTALHLDHTSGNSIGDDVAIEFSPANAVNSINAKLQVHCAAQDNLVYRFYIGPTIVLSFASGGNLHWNCNPNSSLNTVGITLGAAATAVQSWIKQETMPGYDTKLHFGVAASLDTCSTKMTIDSAGKVGVLTESPHSHMHIVGSFASNLRTVSSNTTLAVTDCTVLVNTSGGAITVTLPTAVSISGREYMIKDTGSGGTNNITIATTSSQTIDGSATQTINTNYGKVRVISNGSNWFVI